MLAKSPAYLLECLDRIITKSEERGVNMNVKMQNNCNEQITLIYTYINDGLCGKEVQHI